MVLRFREYELNKLDKFVISLDSEIIKLLQV